MSRYLGVKGDMPRGSRCSGFAVARRVVKADMPLLHCKCPLLTQSASRGINLSIGFLQVKPMVAFA
jgi:hypothetical protein